jgi:hypothetical protein
MVQRINGMDGIDENPTEEPSVAPGGAASKLNIAEAAKGGLSEGAAEGMEQGIVHMSDDNCSELEEQDDDSSDKEEEELDVSE